MTVQPTDIQTNAADFVQKVEHIRCFTEGAHLLLGQQAANSSVIPQGFNGPVDMQRQTHMNTGVYAPMDDGSWSERIMQARFTFALVLDDIGMKNTVHPAMEPTAKIETRPGSQQWVYIYSDQVPLAMGAGMATAAAQAGISDPFIKGRSHHWFRLPGSLPPPKRAERDAEAAKLGIAPDYTPARLIEATWQTFSYNQVAAGLGLTPLPEEIGGFEGSTKYHQETGDNDPVLIWLQGAGLVGRKRQDASGFMDVVCPNHAQHSDQARPWGRFVPSNDLSASAFMCHHAHCGGIGIKAFRQWVEREGGPTQAVAVGYARDLKFKALVEAMPIPKASDLPPGAGPITQMPQTGGEGPAPAEPPVPQAESVEQDVDAQMRTYIRAEIVRIISLPPLEREQSLQNLITSTGYSGRVIRAEMADLSREMGQQQQTQVVEQGYVSINGNVIANYQSTVAFIEQSSMRPCLAYDTFAGRPMLLGPLPEQPVLDRPRPLEDNDYLRVLSVVCQQHAFARVAKGVVVDAVDNACQSSKYHPVRNYLHSLPDTNTNYLDTWLTQFLKCEGDDQYLREVGRKWLIGAVARIMRPGCQMDNALILEGPQGVGKSTVFRILAGDDHFGDALPNFHDKSAAEYIMGKWIIEMSELTSVLKSELEDMRSFLTRRVENFRPAYGRLNITYERQCVFAGSTNRDDYLRDADGERRFWIVKCKEDIDLAGLAAVRNALWKEAYDAFMRGEGWHLEGEAKAKATAIQKDRIHEDPWQAKLSERLGDLRETSIRQCRDMLSQMDERADSRAHDMRITECLKMLGFVKGPRRLLGGYQTRCVVWERMD